jgi:fibronectin-binding autotransporter adhesin
MKNKLLNLGVCAGLFIAAASAGYGQTSITISNNIFSSGTTGNYNSYGSSGTYGNPTSWTTVSTSGCFSLYAPTGGTLITNAPSGANIIESFSNAGAVSGGGKVYQTLTNDYISGDSYTLTVLAGSDNSGKPTQVNDELVLWNTNFTVEDSYTIPQTTGNGALHQYSLTFTATSGLNGTPIVLGFYVPTQSQAYQSWTAFTDFTLTQNPPATSYLWASSPANANFSNAANWVGGTAPTTGTALVFDASSVTTVTNDNIGATNASLTFSNNAPAYTVNGNSLALTTAINNNSSNTQTINIAIADPSGLSLATASNGGNLAINGALSGVGGLALSGGGTTTLSASNSYTGATTVSAGTTAVTGTLNGSAVTVSGGNLSVTGGINSGAVAVSGGSATVSGVINGGGLTVSGGSATVSGVLTNSGVTVSSGSLALSGSLSGSGGVNVSGGSAVLSGNNTNNTGALYLTGGTLTLQANSTNTVGGISYALSKEGVSSANFDNSAHLNLLSDSNVTFAGGNNLGPVGGYQTQNYFVDQLTSGNSNNTITFAPGGIIVAYTTINVTGSNDGYTLALGNLTGVAGDGPATSLNANGANLQIGAFSGNTLAVGGSNNTTITGGITSGVDTISKSGSGTLVLSGSVNSSSGGLTISGGAVQLAGAATIGSSGITDNAQFIDGSSSNQTYAHVISGSGAVTVNGSGSLTLNAANSYTGKTTIASGSTLLLGSSGSLASTNIYLASGTLDVSAVASPSLGSTETLSGSGAVNAGSGTLTVNGNITPLVGGNNGLISLTGGLTLAGSSTTTLELTSATTAGST